MIWQAFTVVDFQSAGRYELGISLLSRPEPFRMISDTRLRRVAWFTETPVVGEGALHHAFTRSVRVAVAGADRSVAWPDPLTLDIIRCGETCHWTFHPVGSVPAKGQVTFTFDFEHVR